METTGRTVIKGLVEGGVGVMVSTCCISMEESIIHGTIHWSTDGRLGVIYGQFRGDALYDPINFCPFCGGRIAYV